MVRLSVTGRIGQNRIWHLLVKNNDLLLVKANSIAPYQAAGKAGFQCAILNRPWGRGLKLGNPRAEDRERLWMLCSGEQRKHAYFWPLRMTV